MPSHTLIIPTHNEKPSIEAVLSSSQEIFNRAGIDPEMIVVDDGSDDGSRELWDELILRIPRLTVVILRKHYGKSAALRAGMDQAQGQILIIMDGDLQNDPADIPLLLGKLREGYDMVVGWRKRRRDGFWRSFVSACGNLFCRLLLRSPVHDLVCGLSVFKKEVAAKIRLAAGEHRFFPWLAAQAGFRVTESPVTHHPRRFGRTKFKGFGRYRESFITLIRLLMNKSGGPSVSRPEYEIEAVIKK